ncbi:TetR/AcrR family transcriptional regulator [Cellulomonas fimi]|uniref:Regulatory protein TetR n=1 Tax=Cellulomonas fimi (strain ATCC 484 / DSM 20113 / JCM 1341 / CCUG 24087 / LMG 16345 / NBRC 15513 / NCIMB 8980 / NCTC 7547 / NRS-133) TaxID=590998 RepID=F4H579_CELFA|nr:TetR/AcrR family transcriptional regulator [Cellulomonas fimi]AEE46685.1 regulatory protein TetR [Cellulomonas fimi ATCC 484]NNH07670.1 helix-turn-helix transcriptional regulator [Cellulomonas fimi]VEH33879.1 HTH-type transcriptional repressor KstR2 [Cellulomonas fimi]
MTPRPADEVVTSGRGRQPERTTSTGTDDLASTGAPPSTARGRAKAERRAALLDAAARLFARHGFDGVSLEDLGAAVGVSGPAVYRHFPSKQAVLVALLAGVSEGLLVGGRRVVADAPTASDALTALVRFHADFALAEPDVIRVQDRDLAALAAPDQEEVRDLQRRYVDLWVDVLAHLDPSTDRPELRLRAQATFGLLNSTPHSARGVSRSRTRDLLERMALAALGHPSAEPGAPTRDTG